MTSLAAETKQPPVSADLRATAVRVLIVAEHASLSFGGEANIPLYYFKLFRERGVETWLLVHERTRAELERLLPEAVGRIVYTTDTWLQRVLFRFEHIFPPRIQDHVIQWLSHVITQVRQRGQARKMIRVSNINIVFEPSPISPKYPSFLFGMGVPVVVGPLGGGMRFPPGFSSMDSFLSRLTVGLLRPLSHLVNFVVPGKVRAAGVIIANEPSRRALPKGIRGRVYEVVESGVDLRVWTPHQNAARGDDECVRFVFLGRLADWKGVQFLLRAWPAVTATVNSARLEIIGDGPLRRQLEEQAKALGVCGSVTFSGWLPRDEALQHLRQSDVLVLPSLRECGGAVILEAMALGLPTIVGNWGGPAVYVDDSCGIRVDVSSPAVFIDGLAHAVIRLARSGQLRRSMGHAATSRVRSNYFDWESKADRIVEIFRETLQPAELDGPAEAAARRSTGAAEH